MSQVPGHQKSIECDDELDETYYERLVGLSEMFPEKVRQGACSVFSMSKSGTTALYGISRAVGWFIISSAIIGLLPYNLESTRQEMVDAQKAQEKSLLLGPNAAMTGQNTTAGVPMPMLPSQQVPK
ncbi:mitochondrial import receptor subunit TOM22 homolog [Watersipora subatra]|uniref:mitochondrial import receptor subunit TOM22 homolog n=1 Tax=Watersipora subatra TaxID=2589382 RepID=UPI00355C128A